MKKEMKKTSEQLKKIGLAIRVERTKKEWTQEQLAYEAGLDQNYLGTIERGERNFGILNLLRIAEALSVHPTILFESL